MGTDSNNPEDAAVRLTAPILRKPVLEDWPGPWEKWARAYCYKHLWRVSTVLGNDIEDAVQECALVYVECRNRYGTKINSPAHFCALYKLCVASWFNTLSTMDFKTRQMQEKVKPLPQDIIVASDAELIVKIEKAPSELRDIINIFCNAPKEVMDTLRQETTGRRSKDFFITILRYLGISQQRAEPLEQELRQLLTS